MSLFLGKFLVSLGVFRLEVARRFKKETSNQWDRDTLGRIQNPLCKVPYRTLKT